MCPCDLQEAREQIWVPTYQWPGDMVSCLSLAQGTSYLGHSRGVKIKPSVSDARPQQAPPLARVNRPLGEITLLAEPKPEPI